tara:strand:+ start:926 stop:1291 length:366 start_codon:yes stop_codon:yes gene_type:complete
MESRSEKRNRRRLSIEKQIKEDKIVYPVETATCNKTISKSFVDKTIANTLFTTHELKSEYTKILNDGTNRWMWTIRDKNYDSIGYVLGSPSGTQKEGTGDRNNPWLGIFDFMDIHKHRGLE